MKFLVASRRQNIRKHIINPRRQNTFRCLSFVYTLNVWLATKNLSRELDGCEFLDRTRIDSTITMSREKSYWKMVKLEKFRSGSKWWEDCQAKNASAEDQ